MKKPNFRTRIVRKIDVSLDERGRESFELFQLMCPGVRDVPIPDHVDIVTSMKTLEQEYNISTPWHTWRLHDEQGQHDYRELVRAVHRARVLVARHSVAIQDQVDNLMRLTDHQNLRTLAETILDTLKIAQRDIFDQMKAMGMARKYATLEEMINDRH